MNSPATPKVLEFAREELAGKLKAMCVGLLESFKNPWNMTSEKNQQIALAKMEEVIEQQVRRAVMVIATERNPRLSATVESVTFKDGIKAVLTLDKHSEGRHDLADAEGTTVLIVMANPEQFTGGMEKTGAAPDQNALNLESQPEIRREDDGTYAIYKDKMPMPGGKGFPDHEAAETWLQKQLGIGKSKTEKKGAKKAEEPPPATEQKAPEPEPDLEEVKKAFHAAAKDEAAKDGGEWETGWNAIVAKYPSAWAQDNYAELSAAYADGWEEGTKD
jgi:hypothetical protein